MRRAVLRRGIGALGAGGAPSLPSCVRAFKRGPDSGHQPSLVAQHAVLCVACRAHPFPHPWPAPPPPPCAAQVGSELDVFHALVAWTECEAEARRPRFAAHLAACVRLGGISMDELYTMDDHPLVSRRCGLGWRCDWAGLGWDAC